MTSGDDGLSHFHTSWQTRHQELSGDLGIVQVVGGSVHHGVVVARKDERVVIRIDLCISS